MFSLSLMGIKMRERDHLAQIQACAFENEIPRSEPNGVQLCKQSVQSSEITPLSLLCDSFIAVVGFTVLRANIFVKETTKLPLKHICIMCVCL